MMPESTSKLDPRLTPFAGSHVPNDPNRPAIDEYGEQLGKLTIQKMTLALDTARTDEVIEIAGDWFWIQDASSLTVSIDVGFNDHVAQKITCKKGLFIRANRFGKIVVTHTAQASGTVTIVYGSGNAQVENPADTLSTVSVSGTVTTEETKPATITTTADDSVAATSLETVLAANTDRREAIIKNLAANTDKIRVGDATNTGATRGHELSPGETIILTTTAAIGVYNLGSGAQSVSLVEVAD